MPNELMHHGIKGQKWGVRRTPEQLGHAPKKESRMDAVKKKASELGSAAGDKIKSAAVSMKNRISRKIADKKKPKNMTAEELRERISRLNMEKQYKDLLAQQNPKKTSATKELLAKALKNLGEKALGVAVDNIIKKLSADNFDIDEWRDKDVKDMDSDTIAKVSKWYKDAAAISNARGAPEKNAAAVEKARAEASKAKAEAAKAESEAKAAARKNKRYTVKRKTKAKTSYGLPSGGAIPVSGVVHHLIKYNQANRLDKRNIL